MSSYFLVGNSSNMLHPRDYLTSLSQNVQHLQRTNLLSSLLLPHKQQQHRYQKHLLQKLPMSAKELLMLPNQRQILHQHLMRAVVNSAPSLAPFGGIAVSSGEIDKKVAGLRQSAAAFSAVPKKTSCSPKSKTAIKKKLLEKSKDALQSTQKVVDLCAEETAPVGALPPSPVLASIAPSTNDASKILPPPRVPSKKVRTGVYFNDTEIVVEEARLQNTIVNNKEYEKTVIDNGCNNGTIALNNNTDTVCGSAPNEIGRPLMAPPSLVWGSMNSFSASPPVSSTFPRPSSPIALDQIAPPLRRSVGAPKRKDSYTMMPPPANKDISKKGKDQPQSQQQVLQVPPRLARKNFELSEDEATFLQAAAKLSTAA